MPAQVRPTVGNIVGTAAGLGASSSLLPLERNLIPF